MKKLLKRMILCGLLPVVCWSAFLIADRRQLAQGLIRFHVVANSDSSLDQSVKYQIRDVVLKSLEADLQKITDVEEAKSYLQDQLPKIQSLVDHTLQELGVTCGSHVSLCREKFDIRHYDTFSLPAGVYDSLRIVLGEGQGRNWWCVSFPALCIPATTSGFQDAAAGAGFSEPLVRTLSRDEDYEIRFFFLNQLGKLENIFFQE